jgi:DNA modification methylase
MMTKTDTIDHDLFGNVIEKNVLLRDKFIEPPFSVLDTKSGNWQRRKGHWKNLGIKSEIGRDSQAIQSGTDEYRKIKNKEGYNNREKYVSIFDPALCEVLYHWFCQDGGAILDPFAGGSVRGVVANYLGYKYTGIDIRQEQVDSNREQAMDILEITNQPNWYVGDSNKVLDSGFNKEFDFVFSCPPYSSLEVYSDLYDDISNMPYNRFMLIYESIISKSCKLLKDGCYACFVVGEIRNRDGNYVGFVPDTIRAFQKCGMELYNEAILLNPVASASMRASGNMKSHKLVKIHQNILVFKKTKNRTGAKA